MAGPSILVRFLADTKELKKAADDGEKQMSSFKSTALKTGAAIGGAFAALKVVEFGKDAVAAASDLNESMSKVGVVFGTSAKTVQDWSKNSATALGLSQQAALEAASTYGNLAVSLGLPKSTAATMSKSLVQLAGDMASFNNVPVADALDALKSGMVGEVEPLRRFGVSLSAAQVNAEALRIGLVKAPVDMVKVNVATQQLSLAQAKAGEIAKKYGANSLKAKAANIEVAKAQERLQTALAGGNITLTAAQKAQASYSLIMQQSKTAQGDFARTSGGLANQQRIAAAQFANLNATIGSALLPVIVKLAKVFTQDVVPVLKVTAGFIQKNAGWLLPLAGIIVGIVAAVKIWTAVQTALDVVLAANPIVLIVAAIAALAAGIVYLATKTQFFQTVWKDIQAAFEATWNWIKNNWPILLSILIGPIGLAIGWIVRNWDQVTGAFRAAFEWLQRNWPLIVAIITGPIGLVVLAVVKNFDTIKGTIIDAFNAVIGFFTGLPGRIAGIGATMFKGIANGFVDVINFIIRVWNGLQFTIGGWRLPFPPHTKFPSVTIGTPDIPQVPHLAQGGLITQTGLVFAHAGEAITPIDKVPLGPAVHIENATFNDPVDVDLLSKRLEFALSAGMPV